MITMDDNGLQGGLNRSKFLRKITLKRVLKTAFAPHALMPKRHRGKFVKMALAPHSLLRKRKR